MRRLQREDNSRWKWRDFCTRYQDYHNGADKISSLRFKHLLMYLKQDERTSTLEFLPAGHLIMDNKLGGKERINYESLIEICLWHAALSKPNLSEFTSVSCIAYSNDKKLIASVGVDSTIALWQTYHDQVKIKPRLLWCTRTDKTVLNTKNLVLAQPGDLSSKELSMLEMAGSTQAKALLNTVPIPETKTVREGETFINQVMDITGVSSFFGYDHRLPALTKVPKAKVCYPKF